MPVRYFKNGSWVFDPETIRAMATAFEETCLDLHVLAGDRRGRETVATRIINLAGNGGIDAAALHKRVVTEAHYRT